MTTTIKPHTAKRVEETTKVAGNSVPAKEVYPPEPPEDLYPGLEMIPLLKYRVDLDVVTVGATPSGYRQVFPIKGGDFQFIHQPELRGEVLPVGADWALDGPDGVSRLDAKAILKPKGDPKLPTIYLHTTGVIILPPHLRQQLQTPGTDFLDWDEKGVVCLSSVRLEVQSPMLLGPFVMTRLAAEQALFPDDSTDLRTAQMPNGTSTPEPDWSWLNHVICVGRGRLKTLGVEWTVFSAVPRHGRTTATSGST